MAKAMLTRRGFAVLEKYLVLHFVNSVSYRPKGDIFYRLISIKISHFVRNDNT